MDCTYRNMRYLKIGLPQNWPMGTWNFEVSPYTWNQSGEGNDGSTVRKGESRGCSGGVAWGSYAPINISEGSSTPLNVDGISYVISRASTFRNVKWTWSFLLWPMFSVIYGLFAVTRSVLGEGWPSLADVTIPKICSILYTMLNVYQHIYILIFTYILASTKTTIFARKIGM